jgi:predicted nucleic acid-binding protein
VPEQPCSFYFDTVALSNFALAGRLDLLIGRYGRHALITPEVLSETIDGIVAGYADLRAIEAAFTATQFGSSEAFSARERHLYRELLRVLGSGEASCIVCAQVRGGVVVTDDRTARDRCTERGIEYTGTIGILKACALDGTLSLHEADDVLQAMADTGYYAPVRRISDLV